MDDGVPHIPHSASRNPHSVGGDGGSDAAGAVSEGKLRRRSLGNDEVALFWPNHVATHTDRRLFIADPGNARILSVRLGYHATQKVALRDVAEGEGGDR